ncbi:glycosyltransferase family 2 protein [Deinococcus koreensis]|uniref:glycosyltransferase family 2 protein n=1 Tax=Deinococcus koreensis TaxID=2054903 RepID=UPI0013FDEF6F|nr:glycosyltransferase family 2 protein [Deinococcus koreensis]
MSTVKSVEVVMATYNGENFLRKQLDSLLSQTISEFKLLINDDHSQDSTPEILEEYRTKFDSIEIYSVKCGSARNNFAFLMTKCTGDYVFFADQDDIWLPDKLKRLLDTMYEAEKSYGSDCPILLHSDACLINDSDGLIDPSMWKYQYIVPESGEQFGRILTQNIVTGCTMLANKTLIKMANPMPEKALIHDWWLAIVACAFGKLIPIHEPTIMYRQHTSNQLGAVKFNRRLILQKVRREREQMARRKLDAARQARAFSEVYKGTNQSEKALIFSKMPMMQYPQRILTIFRHGFYKIGLARNLGWIFLRET